MLNDDSLACVPLIDIYIETQELIRFNNNVACVSYEFAQCNKELSLAGLQLVANNS